MPNSWSSNPQRPHVDMNIGIQSLSLQALSSALDVAQLRQQVIASNIANANTPGHATKRVSFSATLEALRDGSAAAQARVETLLDAGGQPVPVQLDREMAEMAQNGVHFQALLKGVSRELSILASAVSEGKR